MGGKRSNLTSPFPNREPLPQRPPTHPPPAGSPLLFRHPFKLQGCRRRQGRVSYLEPPPQLPLPTQKPGFCKEPSPTSGSPCAPPRLRGKVNPSGTQLTFGGARAHGWARGVPEPPGASRWEPSFVRCPGGEALKLRLGWRRGGAGPAPEEPPLLPLLPKTDPPPHTHTPPRTEQNGLGEGSDGSLPP